MNVKKAILFLTSGQQLRESYMRHTVSHFLNQFSKTITFLCQHGEVLELVPNLSKDVPEHQKTASSQLRYYSALMQAETLAGSERSYEHVLKNIVLEELFCLAKAHFTASIFCILYTH